VVVFIHGGSGREPDKGLYRFVAASLAARGIVVVPDHRVFPMVRFPSFIQGAAAAVARTRAHVADYGGDPEQVFPMGRSDGAHIAAMLTLNRQWLGAKGRIRTAMSPGSSARPARMISAVPRSGTGRALCACRRPELTQPITFARDDTPPVFVATTMADQRVLPRNTAYLAAVIRADRRTCGGTALSRHQS
jgi:acetyl esterase/lipase